MVDFVLEDDSGVAVDCVDALCEGGRLNITYYRAFVAGDHSVQVGNGQAAFGAAGDGAHKRVQMNIVEHLERLAGFVVAHNANDAFVDANLGRGDAHAVL